MGNKMLNNAQTSKKDEFYTLYKDVENELSNYNNIHFKNKTIYCNADNSNSSFVKYFRSNFQHLQLKMVVNSCVDGYVEFFDGINITKKTLMEIFVVESV